MLETIDLFPFHFILQYLSIFCNRHLCFVHGNHAQSKCRPTSIVPRDNTRSVGPSRIETTLHQNNFDVAFVAQWITVGHCMYQLHLFIGSLCQILLALPLFLPLLPLFTTPTHCGVSHIFTFLYEIVHDLNAPRRDHHARHCCVASIGQFCGSLYHGVDDLLSISAHACFDRQQCIGHRSVVRAQQCQNDQHCFGHLVTNIVCQKHHSEFEI